LPLADYYLAKKDFPKALVIKVETNQYKLIELPPFDSVNALQHTKVLRVIMSLFGEHVDIVEANIAKNDLATELASSIKTMMNANNEVNETSTEHVLITTKTVTSNSTSDALLSIARDISTEDYRFRRAIDMSTEDAQSIIPIDSDIDMTLDINDALDNALNSALDELL
jgi:hydroxymethylpyrimidine/phosphomethylpyrimidine kinase